MRAAVRRLLAQSLVPHEQQTRCPGPDVPVTSKPSGGHPAPVWAAPDTPATQGAGLHGGTAFRFLLGWRLGVPRAQGGRSRMPVTWRQMSLGSGEVRRDPRWLLLPAPVAQRWSRCRGASSPAGRVCTRVPQEGRSQPRCLRLWDHVCACASECLHACGVCACADACGCASVCVRGL